MSARYWVLIADELTAQPSPAWAEAGLTLLQAAGPDHQHPGMCWWLIDDRGAPPELNHKRVELTISHRDGKPAVTGRSIL